MDGGTTRTLGQRPVLALLALLATSISAAMTSQAADLPTSDPCTPRPPEQSILVSSAATATDLAEMVFASDKEATGELLEPIANVSEHEPELAHSTPTLAKPDLAEAAAPTEPEPNQADPSVDTTMGFHGITPGLSSRRDVFRTWGDPRNEETTLAKLDYRFNGLKSVQVGFDGHVVDTISIQLEKPVAPDTLARRLGLSTLQPTIERDDHGRLVAQVFPERGVTFRYANEAEAARRGDTIDQEESLELVDRLQLQPLKAKLFLLRAETMLRNNASQSLADLEKVMELDPSSTRARWLLSQLRLEGGRAVEAERYAAQAVEMQPHNCYYRMQWAQCLRKLARYDRAVEQIQTVLESPTNEPLVRAQALFEMGQLASLGSHEVSKSAVPLYHKAIEIADKLATSPRRTIRISANQLLVEAHMAIAVEIARGQWQDKDLAVSQWIERASALAEGIIADDPSQLALRLDISVEALTAAVYLDEPIDSRLWVKEAEETVAKLGKQTDDPLTLVNYDWQLGLVYFQAAQIEHRRSAADRAKQLCRQAESKLAGLADTRIELSDTEYLLGRLYFQMGAIHAVHDEDHLVACQWYDQAADRLLGSAPVTTLATPQDHGDALVSMGVSYWQNDKRQRAIEVTQSGVDLIEQAVDSGLLTTEALIIPYGNLAAMHEAMGNKQPANKYQQLAKKIDPEDRSDNPSSRR